MGELHGSKGRVGGGLPFVGIADLGDGGCFGDFEDRV